MRGAPGEAREDAARHQGSAAGAGQSAKGLGSCGEAARRQEGQGERERQGAWEEKWRSGEIEVKRRRNGERATEKDVYDSNAMMA